MPWLNTYLKSAQYKKLATRKKVKISTSGGFFGIVKQFQKRKPATHLSVFHAKSYNVGVFFNRQKLLSHHRGINILRKFPALQPRNIEIATKNEHRNIQQSIEKQVMKHRVYPPVNNLMNSIELIKQLKRHQRGQSFIDKIQKKVKQNRIQNDISNYRRANKNNQC